MIKKYFLLKSILIISLFSLSACDNEPEPKSSKAIDAVNISKVHIRALPPGQKVTAMYMHIKNSADIAHDLIKIEGDISPMIELHTHTNNNGVMQMGQVESIPVAAKSTTKAKPGGYHVMIMGLTKDLKEGDKYDFNFIFKDGSKLPVNAEVEKIKVHSH